MDSRNRMRVLSVTCIVFIIHCSSTSSTITKINTYHTSSGTNADSLKLERESYQIPTLRGRVVSGSDKKSGNVIFSDSFAFSPSSEVKVPTSNNVRSTRNLAQQIEKDSYSPNLAGGFLQNHRLEETLSPEVSSSAAASAAAAATSAHFLSPTNLKLSGDDNILRKDHVDGSGIRVAADASQQGLGRAFVPSEHYGGNGWASHSGSCLFSCGGFGSSPVSCCQLNYPQCCPNPQHEQINFKNLHHGRGHLAGAIGKAGYAWGPPPYNPPPIVRPKPCHPFPYHPPPPIIPTPGFAAPPAFVGGGGSIIHKGIETLKHGVHNIGQLFKDHAGGGWTSGGNGAAGYYFHRRSDNENVIQVDEISNQQQYDINSSKKRRPTRSVHKEFDQVPLPCPVYSAPPPTFGWSIAKPQSVGLGSLIGWSKPGNQIYGGYFGGGGAYGYGAHHGGSSYGKGFGWGTNPGVGTNFCKWDFDCPGILKCCKGVCQIPPQHIF